MIKNSVIKVIQIGPLSYVGGVSIHIKRLSEILKDDCTITFIDDSPPNLTDKGKLNIRNLKDQIKVIKLIKNNDLIHIHSGNWLIRLYSILLSFFLKKGFIVTLHSYRLTGLKLKITNILLSKSKLIIAVSKEIYKKLSLDIRNRSIIKEAFLPPILDNDPLLSQDIISLINKYKKSSILMCANAFRLQKYNENELYGLDQCIEVAQIAKGQNFSLHIFFVVGTIKLEDIEYYNYFVSDVKRKELSSYITILPKTLPFVRLIKECDITLRPTLTDGDAITIREALFLKKKIIASDVVKRPEGTILYKTANSKDLFEQIVSTSSKISEVNIKPITIKDYKQDYLNIYLGCNNLLKN